MLECPEFMLTHGRLPRLGDIPEPWHYRGWLLPYVQDAEMALNGENSRWSYLFEILATGRLPDRAIPKIVFGERDRGVYRQLEKWIEMAGDSWGSLRDLLDWFLWGLALSKEEPRIDASRNEKLYRGVDISGMLKAPYDYFGALISERKSPRWNPTAFFPTPHNVVECMVNMTFHDSRGRDSRVMTVCDPCVGTGRMLLHASNYSLRLYGTDIDSYVLAACLINGALYAPWMSYPVSCVEFELEDWFRLVTGPEPVVDRTPKPSYLYAEV